MNDDLRPDRLERFVGQEQARRILSVLVTAAKRRNEPVPHLLMSGPAGLGKTTLVRIVAAEMNGRLIEMVGSAVKTTHDMTHHLLQLKAHDVLFIDEIHALPRKVGEILYGAMEDGVVAAEQRGFNELMKQIGVAHGGGEKSVAIHRVSPFTLVGATTLLGLVTAPLRSRFRQILELEPYSVSDLDRIVSSVSVKLGFELPAELAAEIARRSRGTARTAVSNLLWLRDVVQGDGGIATMELLQQAFQLKGIDESGLTRTDRGYLRMLVESEEPVGVETIAMALNESVETVTESVEPFLLQQGYISRTPRGRMVTEKARQLFVEANA
jgi:Holliday junction DNA helicase RuvB